MQCTQLHLDYAFATALVLVKVPRWKVSSRHLNKKVQGHKRGVCRRKKHKNKYINKNGQGVINSRQTTTFIFIFFFKGERETQCEIQCS